MINLPEAVWYQYRWTNPNDAQVTESMLAWKDVEPAWNGTLLQKCDELRSHTYEGKSSYKVRTLYKEAQLKQAVRDALEVAAKFCENFDQTIPDENESEALYCAEAIRALIKELK